MRPSGKDKGLFYFLNRNLSWRKPARRKFASRPGRWLSLVTKTWRFIRPPHRKM